MFQSRYGVPIVITFAGQHASVDSACRSATDYIKRIMATLWLQVGNGLENPDLVGATGTAAGQDERRFRIVGGHQGEQLVTGKISLK